MIERRGEPGVRPAPTAAQRNRQKRRRRFLRKVKGFFLFLAVTGGLVLWFLWQQNGIQTEWYTVSDAPAQMDGYRVALLSDLHGKEFGENNRRLLRFVEGLHPDMIAVTGDLIDRGDQIDVIAPLARGLSRIAPTYYVTGNHEWALGRVNDVRSILSKNGVQVLSNEVVTEKRGGITLAIAGVDDPNGYADQMTGDELRETFEADYAILLSHRDTVEEYGDWGYDLVLSGHSHGGVIRIPFKDQGLFSTDRTFFPKYAGGMFPLSEGGWCVVSRGLGSNTVPIPAFRLFNRPDVPVIQFQQEAEEP